MRKQMVPSGFLAAIMLEIQSVGSWIGLITFLLSDLTRSNIWIWFKVYFPFHVA